MDPIADFLTIIKNGYQAKKEVVTIPASRIKLKIAQIMADAGYLSGVKEITLSNHPYLEITLRYLGKLPAIYKIKRVSRPSVRLYAAHNRLPKTLSGSGLTIISTSSGVMTDHDARKKHLGGEIICQVW